MKLLVPPPPHLQSGNQSSRFNSDGGGKSAGVGMCGNEFAGAVELKESRTVSLLTCVGGGGG